MLKTCAPRQEYVCPDVCGLHSYIFPKCRGVVEECDDKRKEQGQDYPLAKEKNIQYSYDGGVIEGDNSWYTFLVSFFPSPLPPPPPPPPPTCVHLWRARGVAWTVHVLA